MEMLSALDATFIYLESEHSPMAIGAVYVIDAKDAPDDFSYQTWRSLVESRLKLSRVFRQRLVEVPLDLSFPYWINDPGFNLDNHLPFAILPEPGGMAELMQKAAHVWGRVLDRERPLWDITFVAGLNNIDGLSKGSFALITRVHHAAVDGKASTEMMTALLDMTPGIRKIKGEDSWQPEDLPSTVSVITRSWSRAGQKAVELAGFVGKVAAGTAQLQSDIWLKKLEPPPRLLSAPPSMFNQAVSSARTFWGRNFDFERIRAIRRAVPGVTINDVVLAICAGGLRRYLLKKGELPAKPLVAMAPISVRGEEGGAGNQVSAMLVGLATDADNELDRLVRINANTRRSKIHAGALPASKITEFLPSETLAAAARVYTRTRLGGHHRPFFNVTITNVPGPPVPLYVAGARIHSAFGMAPILDGLGLILVVLSYNGRISIGINSCEEIVPDPDNMAECIERSFNELELAVKKAGPNLGIAGLPVSEEASRKGADTLKGFHDANQALDKATESLGEYMSGEKSQNNESD
ncbi:MAG TPA: wax ester/triacylglycerol synthase family O-acyltransferase [Xanthomonadales bacterium]